MRTGRSSTVDADPCRKKKEARHSLRDGNRIPQRVHETVYNHFDGIPPVGEAATRMSLILARSRHVIRAVLIGFTICVAALSTTGLHAASVSHDIDVASATALLDAADPSDTTEHDSNGLRECLSIAVTCAGLLGLTLWWLAHARGARRTLLIFLFGTAPTGPHPDGQLTRLSLRATGVLRI